MKLRDDLECRTSQQCRDTVSCLQWAKPDRLRIAADVLAEPGSPALAMALKPGPDQVMDRAVEMPWTLASWTTAVSPGLASLA